MIDENNMEKQFVALSLKSLSSSCMWYQGQGYNLVFPWSFKWIREFPTKGRVRDNQKQSRESFNMIMNV